MKKINNYLVELRDLINNDTEFGLEKITYSDNISELETLESNYNVLYNFPTDLEAELQEADENFNTEFVNEAVSLLSELNVDEITLNVTDTNVVVVTNDGKVDGATGEVSYITRYYGNHENAFDDIDSIKIADFIGYDGNNGDIYYTRYMPGFTDVLFSPVMEAEGIDNINDFLVSNAAEMEQLVHGADFSEAKISAPIVNFLAEAVDVASFGVVPLIEGFVGYDFIRGDKLDEYESITYTVEGAINLITIGGGAAAGGNLSQIVFNEVAQEAAGETASYIANNCGANGATVFAVNMVARIATGGVLNYRISKSDTFSTNDQLKKYLADNRGCVDLSAFGIGKNSDEAADTIFKNVNETSYGKSSEIIQCNTKDAAADELARRIGGQSRSAFLDDSIHREFDVISDEYIAQAKPALKCVNKTVRSQMKATFEAAEKYGRKVYYQFEGIPGQEVIDKLYEYSKRYGVEVIIDTEPLGVLN